MNGVGAFSDRKKKNVFRVFYRPFLGKVFAALFHDQIPCQGCVIDTTSPVVVPRVKAKLVLRGYEYEEIGFVKRYLRPDLDAVDLGSSLGVVAAHIGRKLDPDRRLVCVEANPNLLELIRINVNRNAPHVRLAVAHGGVEYPPDHRTHVKLVLGFDNLVSKIIVENSVESNWILVPVVTLSQILREHGVSDYTLVSDIEGSEAGLLQQEGEALARCQQVIIELHTTTRAGQQVTVDKLYRALQDRHGFKLRDHSGLVFVFER